MNRVVAVLVTILFAAQSIACAATLNNGSKQVVQFTSVPAGATVSIDSRKFKTPAGSRLDTRQSYSVQFSKPGYRDEYVSIDRKISPAFWVGLFFMFGPLELLSFFDGSAFELTPSEVSVTMEEAPAAPEVEGTPPS